MKSQTVYFYRSTTNSMNWEYFLPSYCRSKLTGRIKNWLRFNGQVYKLELFK